MADGQNLGAINQVYTGDLNTPSGSGSVAPSQMYGYLLKRGANPNEAHLLTSASASESGLNPNAVHDGGVGYGMFGHNGTRLLAMKQYANQTGQPLSSWQTQASFALQELRSRSEAAAAANATTPEQLALAEMHYEQPQGFTSANPEQGHNYTGRLNTIRRFTQLNPNATGAFAPGNNPQVSSGQVAGATGGMGAGNAMAAPGVAAAPSSINPFASVGDPTLNAALAKIVSNARPAGQQPLISQALAPIAAPFKQALSQGDASLHSGLSSLLGGSPAGSQYTPANSNNPPAAAPASDPVPNPAGVGQPANVPLPVARPSSADLAAAAAGQGQQQAANSPSILSALSGLFGGTS